MESRLMHNPPFPRNYADRFLVLDHGKGSCLYDAGGKKYLDFGSGIAVNSLGYGRKDLAEIASRQMEKLIHVSNLYTTEPAVKLAEKLTAAGGFEAVHFGNSGSEANEAALKYARVYARHARGREATGFLSFTGGFHGRTMGALSVTATRKYREPFDPLLENCHILPYNDPDALWGFDNPDKIAAVIVEAVQGEGGLEVLSPGMIGALNSFCRKHNILLIADEVQTGLGRCGGLFASVKLGLQPDIITLSKPLAGGLPLSATLIPSKVNALLHPGDHGTTFGGGPVTTAVALKVFDIISQEDFLGNVERMSDFLDSLILQKIDELKLPGSIKGLGLLKGLTIQGLKAEHVPELLESCRDKGLLVLRSGKNVIRMAPPLTISKEELREGVNILFNAIKELKEKQ